MDPLSLLELNTIIKQTLDLELEPSYWVVAEIGELRLNQRGHCYMELIEKDDNQIKAKIRANIWASNYRKIGGWFETITNQPLKAGISILANVTIQFHELYGLSLTIKDIDPNYTLGERARKKQEVIDRLTQEGVFDMNKDLEIPLVPQNIAVISASSAAGFGDFVDQITNNEPGYRFNLKLFQAVMQGDQAAASIIEAMMEVFDDIDNFDVLIIIRGGGAQVDLDCFDDYELTSHIAQFPLPVFTGIGHERDETISDLVAHTKLKTPTAVASHLINLLSRFDEQLDHFFSRVWHNSTQYINQQQQLLENYRSQIKLGVNSYVSRQSNHLNQIELNLKHKSELYIQSKKSILFDIANRIKDKPFTILHYHKTKVEFLEKSIHLLDPKTLLARGYSITTIDGQSIHKIKTITSKMKLITTTQNHQIESTVETVKTT